MYRHTQVGWVIIISFFIMFFLLGFFTGPLAGKGPFVLGLAVFVLAFMSLFWSLTVDVSNELVTLAFGVGLIRYKLPMSNVVSARIRRIKWYSGFGIHGWPGKGWLLNVSGLDTVELTMKNGMRYLIGTDEPQQLYDAIARNIKS